MRASRRAGDFPVLVSKRRSAGSGVAAPGFLPGAHGVFPAVPRARGRRAAGTAAGWLPAAGRPSSPPAAVRSGEQPVMARALGVQALLGPQGAVTVGRGELLRRLQPGLVLPG